MRCARDKDVRCVCAPGPVECGDRGLTLDSSSGERSHHPAGYASCMAIGRVSDTVIVDLGCLGFLSLSAITLAAALGSTSLSIALPVRLNYILIPFKLTLIQKLFAL